MRPTLQTILFFLFFVFIFLTANAATDDIVKQIQAQLPGFTFTKDLKQQDKNDDVYYLQRFLRAEGFYCKKCYVNGYFGLFTKNALIAFQKKYGLEAVGMVNSATRAKLNQISLPTPRPSETGGARPNASIIINQGAEITNNRMVLLFLSCENPREALVRYSNGSVFTKEPFVIFDRARQWQLTNGDGLKTVSYQCKDNAGNITTVSSNIMFDSSPPIRFNGKPTGIIPSGVAKATISFATNEPAICRYSLALGTDYEAMQETRAFSKDFAIAHSLDVFPLENGLFSYVVRCKDALGNKNMDDFLITFRVGTPNSTSYDINVLVLKYFPLTPDKLNIDLNATGNIGDSYTAIWQKTIDMTSNLKTAIEKASTYLGYKDSGAQPSLRYTIVDIKKHEEAIPANYSQILNRENICNYVDGKKVREVWLFSYQGLRNGDMPLCSKTYWVYTFDYSKGVAEALRSWGNEIEAELDAVDHNAFRMFFQTPINNSVDDMVQMWQNLPGSNNIETYLGKQLRNWWDVHGDFDNVMANNKQLTITP